jgi:hypothetical protein
MIIAQKWRARLGAQEMARKMGRTRLARKTGEWPLGFPEWFDVTTRAKPHASYML